MPNQRVIALLACLLFVVPSIPQSSTAASSQVPAVDRPNIVLVVADDLDARSLEDNLARFPNIAALKAQGVSFEQFFATTPLCCPARASLLRGQYAHNHGVLQNGGADGGFAAFQRLGREESTVATWLKSTGYRTGLFGKYLNGYPADAEPAHVPDGWDEWVSFVYGPESEGESFFSNYTVVENGRLLDYGGQEEDYSTDVLTGKSDAFVRSAAAAGVPFFAYLAPYAPHEPALAADRHADQMLDVELPAVPSLNEEDVSDKPTYVQDSAALDPEHLADLTALHQDRLRSMLAVDEMVGTIMQALEETGAAENTYIVFTSDNGFLLGQHRLPHGKQAPYEEAIRIPLFIRGPEIEAGQSVSKLALNIDLAPSIADWAGVSAPDFVDGRSLTPLITAPLADGWRHAVLIENFRVPRERRRDDTPITRGSPPVPPYRALRTESMLYVEYESGERELYDLVGDPYQLENRASDVTPEYLGHLAERLELFADCVADQCRAAEDMAIDAAPLSAPDNS